MFAETRSRQGGRRDPRRSRFTPAPRAAAGSAGARVRVRLGSVRAARAPRSVAVRAAGAAGITRLRRPRPTRSRPGPAPAGFGTPPRRSDSGPAWSSAAEKLLRAWTEGAGRCLAPRLARVPARPGFQPRPSKRDLRSVPPGHCSLPLGFAGKPANRTGGATATSGASESPGGGGASSCDPSGFKHQDPPQG